ncbi:TolC family protein [Candidatus Methylomirabilis sp.]|uniref:TolC family protein n=1 Tax=Candidatus Methylomirabilis sp. TaxID=2032687 RepID=UPI003C73C2DA
MHYKTHLVIGVMLVLLSVRPCAAEQALTVTLEAGANLGELLAEGLRSNPEILAARKAAEAAQARIAQARSLDDPELNIESWSIPLNQPGNFNKANTHMVNLRQRLPFPGKLRLRGEVASQEQAMAAARYRAKEREVIAAVKKGYYDLFMADREIQITQEQLDLLERILKIAEVRYSVGKVTQQDVLKAQVEQSDLINRLIIAEQERATAEARLNTLLNRHTDAPIGRTTEHEPPAMPFEQADLYKLALDSSPQVQEAASGITQAERSHELAIKNQKYPDFTVGLGYWYVPQADSQHTYTGMLTFTIPFFWTKSKHDKEVEEASAQIARAEASYRATKNLAFLEVRESTTKLNAARKSVTLYRTGLLPQAELSLKAAEAAYQTGRLEFTGLLETERSLRDVRLGYYRTLVTLEQSLADLERAVGRDIVQ